VVDARSSLGAKLEDSATQLAPLVPFRYVAASPDDAKLDGAASLSDVGLKAVSTETVRPANVTELASRSQHAGARLQQQGLGAEADSTPLLSLQQSAKIVVGGQSGLRWPTSLAQLGRTRHPAFWVAIAVLTLLGSVCLCFAGSGETRPRHRGRQLAASPLTNSARNSGVTTAVNVAATVQPSTSKLAPMMASTLSSLSPQPFSSSRADDTTKPLIGGFELGQCVFYQGEQRCFKSGNRVYLGLRGSLAGPGFESSDRLAIRFEGNPDVVDVYPEELVLGLTELRKREEVLKHPIVGAPVVRGPHWQWMEQDGGQGNVGVTISDGKNSWVRVRWANGHEDWYRAGAHKAYDLKLVVGHSVPSFGGAPPTPIGPARQGTAQRMPASLDAQAL